MTVSDHINEQILGLLATSPGGLRANEILARLPKKISQPTLSRRLQALRAGGQLTVEGSARATRYHAANTLPELRSHKMHQAIAMRLARQPELLAEVRARLETLRQANPHGRRYHDRWAMLLDQPLPVILRKLNENSDDADTLRKESPFTVLLDADMRERVFRHFGSRHSR